jgi:hypothetical protein
MACAAGCVGSWVKVLLYLFNSIAAVVSDDELIFIWMIEVLLIICVNDTGLLGIRNQYM